MLPNSNTTMDSVHVLLVASWMLFNVGDAALRFGMDVIRSVDPEVYMNTVTDDL